MKEDSKTGNTHLKDKQKSNTQSPAYFTLFILGILVLTALGIANPSEAEHARFLVETGDSRITELISSDGGEQASPIIGEFTVETLTDPDASPVKYHNFILLSTTTFNGELLTVGILGMIFLP